MPKHLSTAAAAPVLMRNCIAFAIAASVALTGAAAIAQIEFPAWGNSTLSPVELALWAAICISLVGTLFKIFSIDETGIAWRYWILAALAMAGLLVSQSADWLVDTKQFWNSSSFREIDYSFNAILAGAITMALFWLAKRPNINVWVGRCLQTIIVFQILSVLSEATETNQFWGHSHGAGQFVFLVHVAELVCIELYIVGLTLSQNSIAEKADVPIFYLSPDGKMRGLFVGYNARRVYEECNLFRGAKHPPVAIAFYPVFKEVTVFLVMSWLAMTAGRALKGGTGKSVISQFNEMTSLWFNDGIDPPSYYAQDLYKPQHQADAAHYLTRYETKNGLMGTLNKWRPKPYPVGEMANKLLFADCCRKFGIPHPQILLTLDGGKLGQNCLPGDLETDLFCKRRNGMGAIGTMTFRHVAPQRYLDAHGQEVDLDQVIALLKHKSEKTPMLVQPWLRNHHGIADLAMDSLITIRVVTCLNEEDSPEITLSMIRLLAKLEPQWQHLPDEEYASPINIETGELGLFTGDNFKTSHLRYENHLVTGAPIKGRILAEWDAIKRVALAAHQAFPHRLIVGWDIALTENGPVLLEGNTNLDVMFLQRVHDEPIGRSRLGELMNFHLNLLYREKKMGRQLPNSPHGRA
jgi:hypothetical protein